MSLKTLIMGASANSARYAYKAAEMLLEDNREIVLFGRRSDQVFSHKIHTDFKNISDIDTVTIYLSPENQQSYEENILELKPRRVIFNPGAENFEFANKLESAGIETLNACTLVMLKTRQF